MVLPPSVAASTLAHRPSGGIEKLKGQNEYIVLNGRWYAVHYDFLGGEAFGEVLDLETIIIAPASVLERKMPARLTPPKPLRRKPPASPSSGRFLNGL